MKKLLLAAVALVGLAGFSASAESFKDGHYYKLRNVDYPEFYLHMSGSDANATFDSEANATLLYVTQNPDVSTKFLIREGGANGNILTANSWNTVCNGTDTSHFWTVTEVAGTTSDYPVVYLSQSISGALAGDLGTDYNGGNNTDKKLYCNKGTDHHRNWEVIEVAMPHLVNYTVKLGETTVNTFSETVAAGAKYSTPTPPAGVSFSETINDQELSTDKNITVTVATNNDHFFKLVSARYTGDWATTSATALTHTAHNKSFADGEWFIEIPEASNPANFKIWSVNHAKYVGGIPSSGAVSLSATTPGIFKIIFNANGSEGITNSSNTVGVTGDFFNHQGGIGRWHANNDSGSYWFMVFDETAWDRNKLSFCYQQAEDGTKSLPASPGANGPFSTDYTYPYKEALAPAQTKLDELNALTIELTAAQATAKTALAKAIGDAQGARFGGKDVDVPALIETIETAMTNVNNQFNEHYVTACNYIANGNAFAALGIASADGLAAWDSYKASFDATTPSTMTAETVTAAINAYTELVASSNATAGGAHIKLSPKVAPAEYLCIGNNVDGYNGLTFHRASAAESNGKATWTLKAATGGFYLYNEYTNAYAKFPGKTEGVSNATTSTGPERVLPVTEAEASLFVFDLQNAITGRVGIKYVGTDIGVDGNHCYLHANGGSRVVRWEAGDNSSWYISASDADAAADEYVNGAMDNSTNITSSDVTGFYSTDVNAVNTARAIEAATNADKRTKGNAIYAALATQVLNMPVSGKLYTIRCTDTANSRGNLQYAEGYETISTSGRNGVAYNADDAKQQWAIYTDANDKMYLYNVAAKLFANIYYERPNHNGGATNEDYCWRFSKVPTEITEFSTDGMAFDATEGHGFGIYAAEGKNTTSGRHAGMFVVNGITEAPVPASAGFGSSDNGIGFWLTEAGTVSAELQAEMQSAYEAAAGEVAAAKSAYEAAAATEANENVIGHYTSAGFTAYTAAGTSAADATDNDTKHFHYTKGLAAERVALEHEAVYTLRTSENKHYAVIDGVQAYTEAAAAEGANTHYWQANVEGNGNVYFTHTYNDTVIELQHNGATRFTVAHGTPGTVTLVAAEAEEQPAAKPGMRKAEGENALTFVITKATEGSAATTSISEISVEGAAQGAVYDLQGRRLATPAKGINIIGGRKVLVK